MDEGCDELAAMRSTQAWPWTVAIRPARRRVSGLSLTELLVTVGIVGVLAATALPAFGRFAGQSRVTVAANEFVFSLQTARSEAIKRIAPVVLCPSSDVAADDPVCSAAGYESGWIVYVDANNNGAGDAGEPVLLRTEAPEGNIVFAAVGIGSRVRFNGSGASVQNNGAPLPGSVTLTSGDTQSRVTVQANGRVTSAKVL